jgi:hypothetical protein
LTICNRFRSVRLPASCRAHRATRRRECRDNGHWPSAPRLILECDSPDDAKIESGGRSAGNSVRRGWRSSHMLEGLSAKIISLPTPQAEKRRRVARWIRFAIRTKDGGSRITVAHAPRLFPKPHFDHRSRGKALLESAVKPIISPGVPARPPRPAASAPSN